MCHNRELGAKRSRAAEEQLRTALEHQRYVDIQLASVRQHVMNLHAQEFTPPMHMRAAAMQMGAAAIEAPYVVASTPNLNHLAQKARVTLHELLAHYSRTDVDELARENALKTSDRVRCLHEWDTASVQ